MQSQSNTTPRENSCSLPDQQISICNSQYSCDEQSQEIKAILQSGKPLFVAQEIAGSIRKTQTQQEMMKRKILTYNRREKSLEQLSRKFVQNFEQGREVLLQLDRVMQQLKVERRRIYDVVNIFQSLRVIRKASKNNYIWRGLKEAVKTINNLNHSNQTQSSNHPSSHKSLQNLASRFLHILVTHNTPITLDEAAKLLNNNTDGRTKLRRLYDIINVFKSIGLVQKVTYSGKKTCFMWMGTEKLQKIINDKNKVCQETNQFQEVEKQNKQSLNNNKNINQWFNESELRAFATLTFMKQFSQKMFLPSIIMHKGSRIILPVCEHSLNDLCN